MRTATGFERPVPEPDGLAGPDPRSPRVRLEALVDGGRLRALHPAGEAAAAGVMAAHGFVDGAPVVVYATDGSVMGGALGAAGCAMVVDAIDAAVRRGRPVIGLWHSGGARLAEGVEALDSVGRVFAAIVRASGRIPQVSVVLGPAAGGAAYGPALTDVVVMAPAGRVFVTGPDVVRSVTGEQVDAEALGGPEAHGRRSGVVHVLADSDADALVRARRVTGYFARPGAFTELASGDAPDPRDLLPAASNRAYDVHPLLGALLDGSASAAEPAFEELQPGYARNVVIGFGRLGGRAVGVIANNPLRLGGCLDSPAAEKAARFVRLCDAFAVPLVVVVDVPGYLPGVAQEWDGVVRRGAKLLHAFADATVPRVTLVTRKSYGGAYIAMNSRSLGASAVFAWPDAEVAVMSATAAVGVLKRKELAAAPAEERDALRARLVEEHERLAGGVGRAAALGVVDEVIEPAESRARLVGALAARPLRSGRHGNIPL